MEFAFSFKYIKIENRLDYIIVASLLSLQFVHDNETKIDKIKIDETFIAIYV